MCSFKSVYFVIFMLNLYKTNNGLSDKRLCVDPECKEPVSTAKTLLRYSSPETGVLSFAANEDIIIYSKEAGSETSLWGAEIRGKRGYVPKHLVREQKVLNKPTILVNTETGKSENEITVSQVPDNTDKVDPHKVQEPFEVVDGTTLFQESPETINPTNSENGEVLATTVPSVETKNTPQLDSASNIETEKPSGVNKVISTISNWLTENSGDDSSEGEAEDDDSNDDDDDETEDDEVSQEIPEINITTYNDQQVNEENLDEKDEIVTEVPVSFDENLPFLENVTPNPLDVKTNEVKSEIANSNIKEKEKIETASVTEVPVVSEENSSFVENVTPIATGEIKLENADLEIIASSEEINANLSADTASEVKDVEYETIVSRTEQNIIETSTESGMEVNVDETISTNLNEGDVKTISIEESVIETTPSTSLVEDKLDSSSEEKNESTSILPTTIEGNNIKDEDSNEQLSDNEAAQETLEILAVDENSNIPSNLGENVSPQEPLAGLFNHPSNPAADENFNIPQSLGENVSPQEPLTGFFNSHQSVEKEVPTEMEEDKNKSQEVVEEKNEEFEEKKTNKIVEPVQDNIEVASEEVQSNGFLDSVFSFLSFGGSNTKETSTVVVEEELVQVNDNINSIPVNQEATNDYCDANLHSCGKVKEEHYTDEETNENSVFDLDVIFSSNVFLYLLTTAISVILFLFGHIALDKSKREGPLIARINKLEQQLLVVMKENDMLQERDGYVAPVDNEELQELHQQLAELQIAKSGLEDQVQALEKELDVSTDVGMELNRVISEMLTSSNGSETLKANVEQLQRQLIEQQDTINTINETLNLKETENHELNLELEISNKKVTDLQSEVNKMIDKILRIEEERDQQQSSLEETIVEYQNKYKEALSKEATLTNDVQMLQRKLKETEREVQLKIKEYNTLKTTVKEIKAIKNDSETFKSLLDSTAIKAELQQLKTDNKNYVEKLQQEIENKILYQNIAEEATEEAKLYKNKFEEVDKEKVQIQTKLDVLNSYFKEKEAQMQKEISKHQSMFAVKEGEASSTTERIKYMQEELQNYKAQNESLKQEIISQEVELKSQISMLEKKVHENWVNARQIERKWQDAQQEAAQLRNRLTMRERALNEKVSQNRMTSPLDQNGDLPISPHPVDCPASPPLLFGGRELLTKSPPLSSLPPPPFLPPPPGAPFMPLPPLHGMPPMFMPRPPNLFPGDHRPPPLGRLSSPPLSPRFSPDSSAFSPYDRNSPSPTYDSEYDAMDKRGYSPYDRRDFKRQSHLRNGRSGKGSNNGSLGSDHSNDSIEKISRKHPQV